jgi:transposase
LCWHLLTKETDYLYARPAMVAKKIRDMELASGQPAKKGGRRGAAYAYNIKSLRDQEKAIAENAERAYVHLVNAWQPRPPKDGARGRLKTARHE